MLDLVSIAFVSTAQEAENPTRLVGSLIAYLYYMLLQINYRTVISPQKVLWQMSLSLTKLSLLQTAEF